MLYNKYYLQNCKIIKFKKITNHTKYKYPNILNHLHIFWLNFDEANYSLLHPFLLLGQKNFCKDAAWKNE